MVVEELLEPLVGVVDTQLFEAVELEEQMMQSVFARPSQGFGDSGRRAIYFQGFGEKGHLFSGIWGDFGVLGSREQGAEEKHFGELGRKVIFLSGSREQRPPPLGGPHLLSEDSSKIQTDMTDMHMKRQNWIGLRSILVYSYIYINGKCILFLLLKLNVNKIMP